MKRLGALVAAVLLVVMALWVRGRVGGAGLQLGGGEASGTVICATELTRACEKLHEEYPEVEIRIQSAGFTTFTIMGTHPGGTEFDVWLAPQPWPSFAKELLKAERGATELGAASKPLAHSRLAFFVHESRVAAFNSHCGTRPGWRCLLSAASAPSWQAIGGDSTWGKVKPYLAHPLESSGLLALGGAAAGVLEPPIDGATIRDSSELVGLLSSLKRAQALGDRPPSAALTQMLAAGPSVTDIVTALESERDRFGAPAASKAALVYPAPVVSAEVVAVPRRGSDKAQALMDLLTDDAGREALTSTGWKAGAAPADQRNSPSIGSHIVLRDIWEEIR